MNRNNELIFLIHVFVFIIFFVVMNKINGFNVFNEMKKAIDEVAVVMREEGMIAADIMYTKNNINKETISLEIEEYRQTYLNLVDEAIYRMKYYIPALLVIFIIVFMNIELYILDHMKIWISKLTYNKLKDVNNRKMKEIIKEKLKLKYRRIFLPKHLTTVYLFFVILNMIFEIKNLVLLRTIENIIFIGAMLIVIYGVRIVISFFKNVSGILKILIVVLNIMMGFLYPQVYFFIGFLESIMNVKIVVRKIDK